jgi:two-component sensor histidine kinase/Tfp pilus assembly protein PilF
MLGRLRNLAILHREYGKFIQAIDHATRALEIAKCIRKSKSEAAIHTLIGNIFSDQGNPNQALVYYEKARQFHDSLHIPKSLAIDLNNIGNAYFEKKEFEHAFRFLHRSYKLKLLHDNAGSLAHTLHNLGNAHMKVGNIDSAEWYFTQAYHIRDTLHDQKNIASTANRLAGLYLEKKLSHKAFTLLKEAHQYAASTNSRNLLMENLENWVRYYKQTGDWKQGLEKYEQWTMLRDSIFNIEKLQVQELLSTREIERQKLERENAEQKTILARVETDQEKERAKGNKNLAIILAVFLAFAVILILIVYRQRRKLSNLNQALQAQKEKIALLNQQNLHFTKNALSEITGLLNIEGKNVNTEAQKFLLSTKLRMETINILYKQLFLNTSDNQLVKLATLIEQIIDNTFDALLEETITVNTKINLHEVSMTKEKALNLALIINEICVNACKYAFLPDRANTFEVVMEHSEDFILLMIKDAGTGFPDTVDFRQTKSFGLMLIRLLSKDIKAKLKVTSDHNGLSYYFEIPKD